MRNSFEVLEVGRGGPVELDTQIQNVVSIDW